MKSLLITTLLLATLLLAACGQEDDQVAVDPAEQSATSETPRQATETSVLATMPVSEAASQTSSPTPEPPTPGPEPPTPTPQPPTPTPAETAEPAAKTGPIEITYFTPAQMEGPYYPVEKLADRDNDLTVLQGASGTPAGQIIEFGGIVYDASGVPQPGVLIEIWQTDASGVYLHPGDPGTDQRDRNFQFYGESVTDEDGRYHFRTILPGRYEPRPRHIHVKIKLDGQELLTTQFYFADDPELADEAMFNQIGPDGEYLVISLQETQDNDGNAILVGQRDVILNTTL